VARGDDRREAGRAEPVDRDPGDRLRQPREQDCHTCDVAVVLSTLVRAADVRVLDRVGRDARALDGGDDRVRGEVVGTDPGEHPAVAAHGRADGGQDDGAAHALTLAAAG
jgi:hypothetical protein